jgi:hypothetical protein
LHACLISDCRNPAMVGLRNPSGARIWQHPAVEYWRHRTPATSGHRRQMRRTRLQPDLAKMAGIRQDLTEFGHWSSRIWPKWPGSSRIWPDPEESGQTCSPNFSDSCIFAFHDFFVCSKCQKKKFEKIIFFKNDFVEKFRRKPFYVETNKALEYLL